jgi:polyisoprenoid-binding protein YceI
MSFLRRRWKLVVLAVIAAIAVGIVAIPYVYIHFINKPEPKLTFENLDKQRAKGATREAATANSSLDGAWTVTSGTAGYRVKETLNGQDTEGVGRTQTVEGSFTISGSSVTVGEFSVDVSTLTSDQTRRDNQVRGRLLQTDQFPVASFVLDQPIALAAVPPDSTLINVTAVGTLSLHGVDKAITLAMQARRNGETIEVLGTAPITFSDFGIEDPSVAPFVKVGPVGTLEVSLVLGRAAA